MRGPAKLVLALVAVLAATVTAWAYWTAPGAGAGSGSVGSLTAPTISVPASSAGSTVVTWTQQSTVTGGSTSNITYTVQRKLGTGAFADVTTGGCATPRPYGTSSCTDVVAASGSYTYRVVAKFRSWSATSADAGPVTVTVGDGSPTVTSIVRAGASPTNTAASLQWTVTFSQAVTGVDSTDFALAATGVTGASLSSTVTGSGTTYTVATTSGSTGSGNGTLGLNLVDNDSIQDSSGRKLGGTGTGNGNFTGETYEIDKRAPAIVSVEMQDADGNGWVDQVVANFDEALASSTSNAPWTLTSVPSGGTKGALSTSGSVATLLINEGTSQPKSTALGSFTVALAANSSSGIRDAAGNASSFGTRAPLDKAAPVVTAITRGTSPTNAASVPWTATFSESVTGVTTNDFATAATGPTGTSVTSVTGSGATYTVSAATGSGDGTLGLGLVDDDTIQDTATNKLGGTGTGNGDFTGQVYAIDKTAPRLVSLEMRDENPTNGKVDRVVATFDEALVSTSPSNVPWTLANAPSNGTKGALAITGSVATLAITEGSGSANTAVGSFTVALSANAAGIRDALGNQSSFAATGPSDAAGPVPTALMDSDGLTDGKAEGGETLAVTFSESILQSSVFASSFAVSMTDAGGNAKDTISIPHLSDGAVSMGDSAYVLNNRTLTFSGSSLAWSSGTANTVTLTLGPAGSCTSSGTSCASDAGLGRGGFAFQPSTELMDAAGNDAAGSLSSGGTFRLF